MEKIEKIWAQVIILLAMCVIYLYTYIYYNIIIDFSISVRPVAAATI